MRVALMGLLLVTMSVMGAEVETPSPLLLRDGSVVTGTADGLLINGTLQSIDAAQIADVAMPGVSEPATVTRASDLDHVLVKLPMVGEVRVVLGWVQVDSSDRKAVDEQVSAWVKEGDQVRLWTASGVKPDRFGKLTAIVLGDRWQKTALQYRLVHGGLAKPAADLTALPKRFAALLSAP